MTSSVFRSKDSRQQKYRHRGLGFPGSLTLNLGAPNLCLYLQEAASAKARRFGTVSSLADRFKEEKKEEEVL